MFIIPIMIFISWQNHNNLWAYLALGVAVTGAIFKVIGEVAKQRAAAQVLEGAQGNLANIENIIKNLKARNN